MHSKIAWEYNYSLKKGENEDSLRYEGEKYQRDHKIFRLRKGNTYLNRIYGLTSNVCVQLKTTVYS